MRMVSTQDDSLEWLAYTAAKIEVSRQRARSTFFFHFATYLIANTALLAWNIYTYFVLDIPGLWALMSFVFWGIGLLIHYVIAIVLFDEWWRNDNRRISDRFRLK